MSDKDEVKGTEDEVKGGEDFNIDTATPEEISIELVNAFAAGDEERARELIKHQATLAVARSISPDSEETEEFGGEHEEEEIPEEEPEEEQEPEEEPEQEEE